MQNRFKSVWPTCALSGFALLAAWPQMVFAAPAGGFKARDRIMSGPLVIVPKRLPDASSLYAPLIGDPIPLMTDALNYARIGNVAKGTKAAVYATVVVTSAQSQSKPGRSCVIYAHGALSLIGAKGKEHFAGDLNVSYNDSDQPSSFRVSNARGRGWHITIYHNGYVSIRSLIRTAKGVRPNTLSFKSDGSDGILWGRDTSGSNPQLISVALAKSVFPLPDAQPSNAPAEPASSAPPAAAPRGMQIEVSGEFTVQNANDGGVFKPDRTLELYGVLYFGSEYSTKRSVWFRASDNVLSSNKGDVIPTRSVIVTVDFNHPETWRLHVWGGLADYDKLSKSDIVWSGDKEYDIKTAVERQIETITMKGGGDENASADLKVTLRKIADIN